MQRFKGFVEGQKGATDAPKGPESYEDQYKRRLVKTTDPEHKEQGFKWRIKGKKNNALTKKLYKNKRIYNYLLLKKGLSKAQLKTFWY